MSARSLSTRVFSFLLVLCLVIGLMPLNVLATETTGETTSTEAPAATDSTVVTEAQQETETADPSESTEDPEVTEAPEAETEITSAVTTVPEKKEENTTDDTAGEPASQAETQPVSGTVVIAASDFQNTDNDHDAGAEYVLTLLNQIQNAGYSTTNGFLFAGDYDYGYDDSATGKAKLQAAVLEAYPELSTDSMVWVQGNHDPDSLVTDGTLSASGAHDAADYGVYVINEQDYMWYNDDEATVQATAEALAAYVDAKIEAGYTKPIFVISHLPLHYNMRTYNDGDGQYANYIFDVLNSAGEAGLNIIFLFGHNHSNGWDDYLGGASVYLEVGDSINIAQASQTEFTTETLNFTYMNAGYVAYYRGVNEGSETGLTMTVFTITEDSVRVERYSENGIHELKSVGVTNSYKNETAYAPNTEVYDSPQTIVLNKTLEPRTVTKGNVSVTSRNLSSLTVEELVSEYDSETYSAYLSFDIVPEGYVEGASATVSIDVSAAGFDADKPVYVKGVNETGLVKADFANNIVTFTTTHFSQYDVMQLADEAINWVEIPGETTYTYRLDTNGVDTNTKYLIVNTSSNGTGYALTNNNGSAGRTQVTISGSQIVVNDDSAINWIFSGSTSGSVGNNGRYLYPNNNSLSLNTNGSNLSINNRSNGAYRISRSVGNWGGNSSYYVRYSNNNWTGSTSSGNVYLYVLYNTTTTTGGYAGMTGTTSYSLVTGSYANEADVLEMVRENLTVYIATDSAGTDKTETSDYEITGSVDPSEAGTYTLTVTYGGKTLGTVTVEFAAKTVTGIDSVEPMTGTVERGCSASTKTGSIMTVSYSDGTTGTIPVTVGMLSGEGLDVNTNGTYSGLTVTYGGFTVPNYTLNVVNVAGNDFPEYPDGGAVMVNKSAEGQDFQNTGVARVELSTSGLPAKKGIDVIIMVDTSSSMDDDVNGVSRLEVMQESLAKLLTQFQTPGEDGLPQDIRLAIADFNNYFSSSSSPYYLDSDDHLTDSTTRGGSSNPGAQVYTGNNQLGAGAFVDISELDPDLAYDITLDSGTNYDYAFDAIYQLGTAIKEANGENERDLYVIFMSDGAPYQYNYFSSQSDPGEAWNDWLTGTYASSDEVPTNTGNEDYYNGPGNKHRMAEAIKGDPNTQYEIIRKNTNGLADVMTRVNGKTNMYTVPGLGATMYTIGFCLAVDKDVSEATMETVIKGLATSDAHYAEANDADQLTQIFSTIGSEILIAAENAYFEDQMGDGFELQMNPTIEMSNGSTTDEISTDITVTTYSVYTKEQVGTEVDGYTVTEADVGKTYGKGTVRETVSFDMDGSTLVATSADADGNIIEDIIKDGVICAQYFFYNTTTSPKTITLKNGATFQLAPETFYWDIGTINKQQFVLSYAVYLSGSLDGKVAEGSYDTNNYATLHYTNWLGNDVEQSVGSPTMAWGGANVSYAFYLVNEDGVPVVNQTTGETGNIINAVKVTNEVLYQTMNLNSGTVVLSAVAKQVLPDGYELYDENAEYAVTVHSGEGGGSWVITSSTGLPQTTYVTHHAGTNEYSNVAEVNDSEYDYTHTTVYFAVKWTRGTMPGTVVIDYGLPVDITALGNDMFGEYGTLIGVGATDSKPSGEYATADSTAFGSGYEGAYGTAAIVDGKVRYTLNSMIMNGSESFSYEVEYAVHEKSGTSYVPTGEKQYYYGDITIIPATTIYYEDSFVDLKTFVKNGDTYTEGNGWITVGNTDSDATQDEDRVGSYNLPDIDANNVYGTDSAYKEMSEYSLGSAAMVTVKSGTYATATFEFYGTGFDIVSLTSNTTGTILVDVYKIDNTTKEETLTDYYDQVDTYYGYKRVTGTDEEDKTIYTWEIVDSDDENALYQVPVVKIEGMPYGHYKAVITVSYMGFGDHQDKGQYDFYLDAIRIYDPAGAGTESDDAIEDAYQEDREYYPDYFELRDYIITKKTFNELNDATVSGMVFIDAGELDVGPGNTEDAVQDYVNFGPNNELYLAPNQAISFNLNAPVRSGYTVDTVQIAFKTVGDTGYIKYYDAALATADTTAATKVSTATDMYYTITNLNGKNVVIMNPGNVETADTSDGAIISITNIKVTYKAAQTSDVTAASEGPFTVSTASVQQAVMSLRTVSQEPEVTEPEVTEPETTETEPETTETEPETTETEPETSETEPEVTEPEVTEPEIFEPGKMNVVLSSNSVKVGGTVVVTVVTSNDVDALTINGKVISKYIESSWTRSRTWIYTVKATAVGSMDVSVVAHNEDGLASEAIVKTVNVTQKSNSLIGRLIGWIFG